MIDVDRFSHLAFDCHGTVVDWEARILSAIGTILQRHGVRTQPRSVPLLLLRHRMSA